MTEHSDRAKYATEQVALWIVSDGDYYENARAFAVDESDIADYPRDSRLQAYLTRVLQTAKLDSAPWYVAQDLAPNDYDRIDWEYVADQLRGG